MGDGCGESEEEDQEDATFRSDHCTEGISDMLGGLNWYGALDAEVTQKQERTSVVRGGAGV